MKKKILISILLLVCFWHFNVKAEELITDVPEVVAGEVTEEVQEEETEEKEKEVEVVSSDPSPGNVENSENVFSQEKEEEVVVDETTVEEKTEEKNIDEETEENPALTSEEENNVETDNELVEVDNNINNEVVEEVNTELANEEETEVSETNNEENYEVTFTHNEYHLSIPGGSSILLSQLINKLGINISMSEVNEIVTSNNEILSIVKVDGSNDYNIKSLKSFTTEETVTIRTSTGEYVIKVTDPLGDIPDHDKEIVDNNDGTYTLSLTVVGDAEKQVNKVNVIVVLDTSNSMTTRDAGPGEATYTPTNGNADNLYGLIDGEYVPLTREGTGNRSTYWYNGVRYNGQRYTRQQPNQTRLEAAKAAVNAIANALLHNNEIEGNPTNTVEMALIDFNMTAHTRITKTTSYAEYSSMVNGLGYAQGTNWEGALQHVSSIDFEDSDPIYVIFVSDGNPSVRVSAGDYDEDPHTNGLYYNFNSSTNEQRAYDASVDEATEIVSSGKQFYTIGAYGDVSRLQTLTTTAGAPAGNYYDASDTAALQEALNDILSKIEMAGIGAVAINDGTTNKVTTSSGISSLLDVDKNSFKYYKNGEEWADAPEADLNADGEVVWDLSDEGVLENGVEYKVTFVVWPSQTTLDLIADLKNKPSNYDTLDANIKMYLEKKGEGYTLRTNTTATLSFKDTREENPQTHTKEYENPDPVSTTATQMLAVTKEWDNDIDGREKTPVTINVLSDNNKWYSFDLSNEKGWTGSAYISVGIMTIKNGVVDIKTTGHDFSFGELGSDVYNWEMKSEVVHPMLINGDLTILVRQGTEEPTSGTYYKIGDYYYTVGTIEDGQAKLTATNERRSWVDLTKTVNYSENATHFDDQTFKFEINVVDPNGDDIWFSVKVENDPDAAFATAEDGLVVTDATADGNSGYYKTGSGTTFTVEMLAGWNLRIINLLTGTTYTIKEVDIDSKFEFEKVDYVATTYVNEEGTTVDYVPTIDDELVTGEIMSTNRAYGYTYTNKNVLTEITVTKIWVDEDNKYSNRPDTITLSLKGGNTEVAQPETYEVDKDGNWVYTYTNLPVFDSNGEITYTLEELGQILGYTVGKVTGNQKDGFTVTNTLLRVSTTVVKEWDDNNDQDGLRPENVTVTLSNGETYVLDESNSWTKTVENLPAYKNKQEVTYTWEEKEANIPTGYTPTTSISGTTTTIKNSHTPETYEITVTKVWEDNSDQDGERPTSVKFTITGTDGKTYDVTLSGTGDKWTATKEVSKYYNKGTDVEFTVDEEAVTGYTKDIDNDTLTITNSYEPATDDITVTKVWNDNSDQDGKRPTSVKFTITGSDGNTYEVTLSGTNDTWTATKTVNKYFNGGETVTFTVDEEAVTGYTKDIDNKTLTITNSYTPETYEITVTKVWNDNSDQDTNRPESVKFTITGTDENTYEVTLSGEGNTWTATKTVNKYFNGGEAVEYTVDEEGVTGYEKEIDNKTLTITNSYEPETKDLEVTKVWDDKSNQDGKRPTSVKFTVTGSDGNTYEVTLSGEGDNWTATVEDVAVYYNKGTEVEFTVDEEEVTGYTKEIDNKTLTITNSYETEKTTVSVEKVWEDSSNKEGFRPENITITLLADGEEAGTITLNEENEWKHTFTELDKYSDGKEIEYTVTEAKVDNYDEPTIVFDKEKNAFVVTNSREYETTEITVTKIWEDNNNQDGIRPESITVKLSNGDTVTLTEKDNWTKTITGLQKYENGKEIVYTVVEFEVDGYETTYSEDTLTITNTHTPEETTITVEKVWADDDNFAGTRPESVTITLLANGKEIDSVVLSEENEWKHTFTELPVKENGKEITYTVREDEVPEGYEVAYEEVEGGFIIHNVKGKGEGNPPDNPQTGDNIILYLITLLISLIGIVSGKLYLRKSN